MRERLYLISAYVVFFAVLVRKVAILLYNISIGRPVYMIFFPDDFYYYAKIADNIAKTGISTFDGFTVTNGYHPLWMAVLTLLAKITGGIGEGFFVAVVFLCAVLAVVAFLGMIRLGRALFSDFTFLPWIVLIVSLGQLPVIFSAMEVALALPLIYFLAARFTQYKKRSSSDLMEPALLGLLSSLLILSRLDALLLVGLGVIFWTFWSKEKMDTKLKQLLAFCIGGILLPVYFATNLVYFGSLMTVSATAKQLGNGLFFNIRPLVQIIKGGWALSLTLPIIIVALVLYFLKARKNHSLRGKTAVLSLCLFPFLFYGLFCIRSDWKIILWYYYPLFPALFVSSALLASHIEEKLFKKLIILGQWAAIFGAALIGFFSLWSVFGLINHWDDMRLRDQAMDAVGNNPAYKFVLQVAAFAEKHPGRYAMGDYAGAPSYLTGRPILQLEGLAADPGLVDHIRNEDDLTEALKEYNIDYLVVTDRKPLEVIKGCYLVYQPNPDPAGQRSKKMTGRLCLEPLLYLETGKDDQNSTVDFFTYIFYLKKIDGQTENKKE